MSTDLITQMKENQSLIAELGLDEESKAIAGVNPANQSKRISIKGGVFRKIVGGNEVGHIEDRHMNVIFVKMSKDASRTFYKEAYKDGEKVSPTCWSSDSRKPDDDVEEKQAPTCAECPRSVKGAEPRCRLSWRTAVVSPENPEGDVMQFVIPSTSCWAKEENGMFGFRPYIQNLQGHNLSAPAVVTRVQFDAKATAPRLLFKAVEAVPREKLAIIKQQHESEAAKQAVEFTVYKTDTNNTSETTQAPVEEKTEVKETVTSGFVSSEPKEAEPVKRESTKAAKPETEGSDIEAILNEFSNK